MKIFNIKSEERKPIIILMLMFFCIVGSSITASSAKDTFFLTQFDKSLLPLMFALVGEEETFNPDIVECNRNPNWKNTAQPLVHQFKEFY